MTKMVRKQLFITVEQNRKLKARAALIGVSEADLIRAGINLRLDEDAKPVDWRNCFDRVSGAWAERDDLDQEMLEIRRRWNRRRELLGRKAKRA